MFVLGTLVTTLQRPHLSTAYREACEFCSKDTVGGKVGKGSYWATRNKLLELMPAQGKLDLFESS